MRANCAVRRHSAVLHSRRRRVRRVPQKRQALMKTRDRLSCAAPLRGRPLPTRLIICAVPPPLPSQHHGRRRQTDRHPELRRGKDARHLKADLLPERQRLIISRRKDPPHRRVVRCPKRPGRQAPRRTVPVPRKALPQAPSQALPQAPSQALPSALPAPVPCAPPHREEPWCPQRALRSLQEGLPELRCPPTKRKSRQRRQEQQFPHVRHGAAVP